MKGMNRVKRGRGFRGVLNYVFGRDAEHKTSPGILVGGNMSGHNPQSLAQEFGVTRNLRPDIEKPVWHNSLRLPAGESLEPDEWVKVADDYMEKMGFSPLHPRCYVMHNDKEGQHVHIGASRIALDGTIYLGQNENLASTRIIQQLEIEHGLTITKGPEYENGKIRMPEVKNPSKPEMEKGLRLEVKPPRLVLQDLLNSAIQEPKTVMQFVKFLEDNGVIVLPNIASTKRLNGFSFELGGLSFKGSSLGNAYKWSSLLRVIDYDQDRDFAELAKRKPVVGDDGRNSNGIESIAGEIGGANNAISGTLVHTGNQPGSGFIYPETNNRALDPGGHVRLAEGHSGSEPRPDTAIRQDGSGAAFEGAVRDAGVERLEAQGGRNADTNRQYAGEVRKGTKDVEALDDGNHRAVRNPDRDTHEMAGGVMAWNTRFKQAAAARKRGTSKSPRHEQQHIQRDVVNDAHYADPIPYLQNQGFAVKREGRHYSVTSHGDEIYRLTRKDDGYFVWCTKEGDRGGDAISLLEELGRTFQQAVHDLSGAPRLAIGVALPVIRDARPVLLRGNGDGKAAEAYLMGRGISKNTILQAQIDGFLRLQDNAVAFVGWYDGEIRAVTLRLLEQALAHDGSRLITKMDVKGSDKRFPAAVPGSRRRVWIVEGGVDALAVADWHAHYHPDQAVPTIIVSGGAGVRGFLDMPHVQEVLRQAESVIITKDREKSCEVQARTDADHEKQILKIREIVGASVAVTEWVPPQGCKDVAEAWQQRVLPVPDSLEQSNEVSGNSKPLVGPTIDCHGDIR
ncbi:relaxase/mobilization nuclease domain-containing protein [Acidithiobacillus sp.]|uniref:relaxase/mobilization nuclease domain-containing protein n=1 Tax=Acidithiobacillus sp. TaxID=1872118 RepID=UPI0025BB906E|nr:relaxase/mobilization nuclease domain-containing protein [Acidithiobacillus sp.]